MFKKKISVSSSVNTKHAVSAKLGPASCEYNKNVIENIEPAVA